MDNVAAMNDLAELVRLRQALALDAEEGQPGAGDVLERVEMRISRVRLEQERRALAAVERPRRDAERSRQENITRQAAIEARYAEIDTVLRHLPPGIDETATAAIVHRVRTFLLLLAEQPTQIISRRMRESLVHQIVMGVAALPHVRLPKRWSHFTPAELAERLDVEAKAER